MTCRRRGFLAGGAALGSSVLLGCARNETTSRFAEVDRLVRAAVKSGQTPGAVVAVGHEGAVVHRYVYGSRSLVPTREPLTWETRYDMASLTKPMVTAPAIMQLVEAGKVRIDDPVHLYLPAFAANGKTSVTVRMLLTHYSGLPPDVPLNDPWQGKAEGVRRAMLSPLANTPGTTFVYSDINFITLGLIVEKLSGLTLDVYARRRILEPLGMEQSGFLPDPALRPLIAPTQFDAEGTMLRGVVHDPTARRMGGVAGHAGLFSDAHDVSLYAQALLDRLAGRPSAYPLRQDTLKLMTTPQQPVSATGTGPVAARGLGWDIDTRYSTPRGALFSRRSFGHTGFTGTSLWLDPESDSYVLILTNRVHPSGGHSVVSLRRDVATAAARALQQEEAVHG